MRRTYYRLLVLISVLGLSVGLHSTALAQDEMEFDGDVVDSKPKKKRTPPPDTTPSSESLENAIDRYDKKDYESAAIELSKVVRGETDDSPANRQRAEFYLGKTLFQMGYSAVSLTYFRRIVELGTGHLYYRDSLQWLAGLSRSLPEPSGILGLIGQYDSLDLEQPVFADIRNELYFLLGRHYYLQGDFEQAIDLFGKVEKTDPIYVKAKFFEGVTFVRQYNGSRAVSAFKEILVIAEERPSYYSKDDIERFQELAWLQLARVFYSTKQFDTSIKYYEKLSQKSPDWLPSLFEASWAYFMKNNNSKALGNIHTLNAPYFEEEFFPESILLKAVIYYKYCHYDRATAAVAEYKKIYKPMQKQISDLLNDKSDSTDFYLYVKSVMSHRAGLGRELQRLVVSTLGGNTVQKTFAWVDELERELEMHRKSEKVWQSTPIAAEILQDLTLNLSLAQADAGAVARDQLERLHAELQELNKDGTKIKIEVLEAMGGQISAKARGQQVSNDRRRDEPIVIDGEHFMWKFNGEYWRDELGFYRFRVHSICPK